MKSKPTSNRTRRSNLCALEATRGFFTRNQADVLPNHTPDHLYGGQKIARNAKGEPIIDFMSSAFAEKRDTILVAAKHDMAIISPCVSDGERQIARITLAAGLPLITSQDKGFSPIAKPAGRYFYACSEGRLLMLAPAASPYTPGEKPIPRNDALVLNRLCQWCADSGAAEIQYRGLVPSAQDNGSAVTKQAIDPTEKLALKAI